MDQYRDGALHVVVIRDDDVTVKFAGLDELAVHGHYKTFVIVKHLIQGEAALLKVASDSARQTDVFIGVHKDLQIQHAGKIGVGEDKKSFHYHNRCWVVGDFLGDNVRIVEGVFVDGDRLA